MTITSPGDSTDLGPTDPDLLSPTSDAGGLQRALGDIALQLEARWESAVAGGDFAEITRLVDASHAVHRAIVALHPDSLVPTP